MKYIYSLMIMFYGLFFSINVNAENKDDIGNKIYFITTDSYPVESADVAKDSGYELIVYNLDKHRNLEKKLSIGLPMDDVEKAQKIASQRVSKLDPVMIKNLFNGIIYSINWDIRKVPAFVFNDGESVIYGVTSVDEALDRFEYWSTRGRR